MIEWNDYIANLLSSDTEFESLTISLEEGCATSEIPPLIKVSNLMLDKMIENQGRLNVLVFPERAQTFFLFTLMKLFHNISSGKIKSNYDPTNFKIGDKLKVGNALVEYLGTEARKGKLCICIKLADMTNYSAPIEHLPIFQKTNTQRRLSKFAQYAVARKEALASLSLTANENEKLIHVADMKTHMNSSIFAMTTIAGVKRQVLDCKIGGKKVTDIFYMGQANYTGEISNIGAGQMAGIPAIVYASDLYAIKAAAENGKQIQSVIIDGSNLGQLNNQLDALDQLLHLNIPVVCITDVVNSFELERLSLRGFNIWRWDRDSLTEQLYGVTSLSSDRKTGNCAKQCVQYIENTGEEISDVMKALAKHRRETESQSPQIMKLFERLNNLAFNVLRETVPFSDMEIYLAQRTLDECDELLRKEAQYLDKESVSDYTNAIVLLKMIYEYSFILQKNEALKTYLKENDARKVFLVIPERAQKSKIQNYWTTWCMQQLVSTQVVVLLPSEYYSIPNADFDVTIICGWLKRAIMRKLIFSYNTSRYIVMLYDYESRWKNHDAKKWLRAMDNAENKKIIEKSFNSGQLEVSTNKYEKAPQKDIVEDNPDELGEIELILRENKFRQYVNGGGHSRVEVVSAVPISFVGSYLAFYKPGHNVISATKIILSDTDKIETKLPSDLRVGDFIVVREADRDLIKEIADSLLGNSGKAGMRETASKWREAIEIELLFTTVDDLYEKMKTAGFVKGVHTLKRWIENESIIAPQNKSDLQLLAQVTQNEVLFELQDKIFEAAQEVRGAHKLAGRKLSDLLKRTIAAELKKYGGIDPFNFWEPIDIEIESIGHVKVLKIIDIGSEIEVSAADTNRLIEE